MSAHFLLFHQRGRLKAVKALGWYLDEQDLAQVSMNLTDYEVTAMHTAFEECSKDAKVKHTAIVSTLYLSDPWYCYSHTEDMKGYNIAIYIA